jgi:hypothetical protein
VLLIERCQTLYVFVSAFCPTTPRWNHIDYQIGKLHVRANNRRPTAASSRVMARAGEAAGFPLVHSHVGVRKWQNDGQDTKAIQHGLRASELVASIRWWPGDTGSRRRRARRRATLEGWAGWGKSAEKTRLKMQRKRRLPAANPVGGN